MKTPPVASTTAAAAPHTPRITEFRLDTETSDFDATLKATVNGHERTIAKDVLDARVSPDGNYLAFTRQTGGEDSFENEAQSMYLYSAISGKTITLKRISEMFNEFEMVRSKGDRMVIVASSSDGGYGMSSAMVIDARDGDTRDFGYGSYATVENSKLVVNYYDVEELEANDMDNEGLKPKKTRVFDLDAFINRNE